MALDEAVCNEWPGREIGTFVSIGTGKRPEGTSTQQHMWWEGFVSGGIGDFAEARRRLIQKIEDCEKTHKEMKDHLAKRQVNPEHYYRLNVTVGVGEFGMNEWTALSEISTNTRMYLAEKSVQSMTLDAASKMARIHFAKTRWERAEKGETFSPELRDALKPRPALSDIPDALPLAIELPAEDLPPEHYANIHPAFRPQPGDRRQNSVDDKYLVVSSDEYPQLANSDLPPRHSGELVAPGRRSDEQFSLAHPDSRVSSARPSFEDRPQYPPPRPPKTPLQNAARLSGLSGVPLSSPSAVSVLSRPPPGAPLPYPDTDGPPPVVNRATKPEYAR